jgi:hypothetical protein
MHYRSSALIAGLVVFAWLGSATRATAATAHGTLTSPARDGLPVNDALAANPEIWIEQKLAPGNLVPNDTFGQVVAISGKTALISEEPTNLSGGLPGLVRVYTETDGTWKQTATLTASNGTNGDGFGEAIAFDGTTAFIGAPNAEVTDKNGITLPHGAMYVFSDSNGTWTQTQEITASDGAFDDLFGDSVALSGNTLMVGAIGATINSNNAQGAVYVFTDSNGTWTQQQKLVSGNGAEYDKFGYSIAIDGTNALISSPFTTVNGNSGFGTVYAFTNTNGTWNQSAMIEPANTGPGYYHFGNSLALSGDNALIGQPNSTNTEIPGAVYAFTNSGGSWTQAQTLHASDAAAYDYFGTALALHGNQFVTSAPGANLQISDSDYYSQGAAYIFSNDSGSWQQQQKLTASDATNFYDLGNSVALSDTTAVIGDYAAGTAAGAAYMYGGSKLGLAIDAPPTVTYRGSYSSQVIVTNSSGTTSAAVSMTVPVPVWDQLVSYSVTKGSCKKTTVKTPANTFVSLGCDLGAIPGNGGSESINMTLAENASIGKFIQMQTHVRHSTPYLKATASTYVVPTSSGSSSGSSGGGSTSGSGSGGGATGILDLALLAGLLGLARVRRWASPRQSDTGTG